MEFSVLGPVQLISPSGQRINLASDAQRRLVSHLVVRANTMVRAEELEDHLCLSPGALRTSVSRLRRIVGFDILATVPPGYELRTELIDAIAFETLITAARCATDRPDARSGLEQALGLWRGHAYAEFSHEEWAAAEAHRLEELRAAAEEDLIECYLADTEWSAAIARLEVLIAEHPFRDRPRGLLMRALDGSGRQIDALRSYQAYRRLLLDEVGTEPSPDLIALDRSIAAPPPAHHLPTSWTSFIGRDEDLATVTALCDRHRLVTLAGAGGCGKTRLATQTGLCRANGVGRHRGPDSIRWVELAPLTSDAQLPERVAAATGLRPVGGADVDDQLIRHLSSMGPILLVLDNAEHVLGGVAQLVEHILGGCAGVHVLVTSREPLGIPGELIWQVPALSLPDRDPRSYESVADLEASDAARLLVDRVRSARPALCLDASSIPAIIAICHEVDGLPLALELAAAGIRSLPLERVANDLRTTLAPLSHGSLAGVPHHQTMEASIAWSIALLDEPDQRVLRRLALFASPFTDEAAMSVAVDDPVDGNGSTDPEHIDSVRAMEAVSHLVDKGLIQLDEANHRYRLLQTTRHFCLSSAGPVFGSDLRRTAH